MKTSVSVSIFVGSILFVLAYAQEKDKLIYSHKFHIEEAGAECTDCHTNVLEGTSASDNLLPAMETCYNCHDEDDTDCTVCHTNPDEAVESQRITDLKANFAHRVHVKSVEDCSKCHAGIEKEESAGTVDFVPSRDHCIDCHGSADFSEEKYLCVKCHTSEFNFIPAGHTLIWKQNHGVSAAVEQESCAHCHQNNYCVNCHEGDNLDRLSHPLNFRNNHGIAARGNIHDCQSCHQEQAFCVDCHQMELVMPRSHSFTNWSNPPGSRDGGRHAREAEYNFDVCQSCHDGHSADLVCMRCHPN